MSDCATDPSAPKKEISIEGKMLKITRSANGEVIFTVSGRMDAENLAELEMLFGSEANGIRITLDLKDLTLVDQSAISFLERCEAGNIQLKNCPAYIREWISRGRGGS
jgi:hypothetical protein